MTWTRILPAAEIDSAAELRNARAADDYEAVIAETNEVRFASSLAAFVKVETVSGSLGLSGGQRPIRMLAAPDSSLRLLPVCRVLVGPACRRIVVVSMAAAVARCVVVDDHVLRHDPSEVL